MTSPFIFVIIRNMKIDEIFANKKVAVDCFPVLIEISKGSKNKYEMDKDFYD